METPDGDHSSIASLDQEESPPALSMLLVPTAEALHAGAPHYQTRHARHVHHRFVTYVALAAANTDAKTLHAFRNCGRSALVLRDTEDASHLKFALITCKHRLCPACSRERAATIAANLQPHIIPGATKFITLTLAPTEPTLKAQLSLLRRSFTRLRNRPLWRERVRGYVGFIELKPSKTAAGWNVHLHILARSTFIPQAQLAQDWLAVTGTSRVVDIRLVHAAADATNYVTKYVTKAIDDAAYANPDALAELARVVRNAKLVISGGEWRALRLLAPPPAERRWVRVDDLDAFLYESRGDHFACKHVQAAWKLYSAGQAPADFYLPPRPAPT